MDRYPNIFSRILGPTLDNQQPMDPATSPVPEPLDETDLTFYPTGYAPAYDPNSDGASDACGSIEDIDSSPQRSPTPPRVASPLNFDDLSASILDFKPDGSLQVTCLTIGSRGDVQPYIALCKKFITEGHKPKIATHREFEPWIKSHGIDFAPIAGDPAELMRVCIENGMFTVAFLREVTSKFRGWLDELLVSAWEGCQGTEVLIESPSTMAGIHIAEALRIPYLRAFTMPFTKTSAYPHAFAVPVRNMGGTYNATTYMVFERIFWTAIAGQINAWRNKYLKLPDTSLAKMRQADVPFLYNFSPSVVPPAKDFGDWVHVTGYWFLDEGEDWTPPDELVAFIKKARDDGKKIIYIGFGSIVVSDPLTMTKTVIDSVLAADVRCILSKGWSERHGSPSSTKIEVPLPPEIFPINSIPHDWLFSRIDAAAHHGGSGTTGASLRAGIPTIIKPFFGDQFFFGNRVEFLEVGVCIRKLNKNTLTNAIWQATNSDRMIVKAKVTGEKIRKEDGVGNAIKAIYRDLEYAKSLVEKRSADTTPPPEPEPSEAQIEWEEELANIEDSWTLIGHSDAADQGFPPTSAAHESGFDLRASAAMAAGSFPAMAVEEDDGEEDVAR